MGILEMDFERILGVTFFISSSHSIMLCEIDHRELKLDGAIGHFAEPL